MRALVTGGLGFIGSHLVDRLLAEGWTVRVVDNLQPRVHPRGFPAYLRHWGGDVEVVEGDVRDRAVWERALRGVEVVFHEAAYQDYMLDFSTFLATNAVSAALLFEVLVERGWEVRKVIVASSQAVYGEGQYVCTTHGFFQPPSRSLAQLERGQWNILCPRCGSVAEALPLREEHANPYNAYALSKLAEELAALRLGYLHGIPTVALRYSITQGPRQSPFNSYSGICRIFCTCLLRGEAPVIFEDGEQRRDYVHIADVVDANLVVLERDEADYQAFNVGGDRAVTVREYAAMLCERLGPAVAPQVTGEYRLGDNRHSVSSVEHLRALGWAPRMRVERILDDYLGWLGELGDVGEYFRRAHTEMRARGVVRQVAAVAAAS